MRTEAADTLTGSASRMAVTAPAAVGTLADVSCRQGSGVKTVEAAAAFSGAMLSYALLAAPAGVSIDAATGVISIPTAAPLAGTVTVAARNASGAATQRFAVTVSARPPVPAPGLPEVPPEVLSEALGKPLTRFDNSVNGTPNCGFFGGAMVIEAYAAFAGQQAADSHVLEQLRHNLIGGNCPGGAGGYGLQHQLHFAVAAAIAKRTPRVWDELTPTERTRIELLVKAVTVGAAKSSDKGPFEKDVSLVGAPDWGTGANANWRNAKPAVMQAARSVLGSDAAVGDFLDGFDREAFAATLASHGLDNAATVSGDTSVWSHAQVEAAVKGWRFRGKDIGQLDALIEEAHRYCFGKTVMSGHGGTEENGWIGPGITVPGLAGVRARIQANAEGLPNKGEVGMLQEFDAKDAEGKRSSATYSSWGYRISMDMLLLGMVDGTIDRTDPATQATMQRIDRGHVDLVYKSVNGYWSFAHNGEGGNNDVWQASTHADTWAWAYNHEIWPRIVKPWVEAG